MLNYCTSLSKYLTFAGALIQPCRDRGEDNDQENRPTERIQHRILERPRSWFRSFGWQVSETNTNRMRQCRHWVPLSDGFQDAGQTVRRYERVGDKGQREEHDECCVIDDFRCGNQQPKTCHHPRKRVREEEQQQVGNNSIKN